MIFMLLGMLTAGLWGQKDVECIFLKYLYSNTDILIHAQTILGAGEMETSCPSGFFRLLPDILPKDLRQESQVIMLN